MNAAPEAIRRIVREELARLRGAELATVQETHPQDPGNYACTVVLRDTGLVLEQVPLVTPRKGFASVPEAGDLVLVQFAGHDLNRPLILGTLYNDEHRPPDNAEGQLVLDLPGSLRLVATGSRVTLTLGDSLELELQTDDPAVRLDVGGNATLEIDSAGGVTLSSMDRLEISTQTDLKLTSSSNLELEAAANLNLKAGAILKLEGALVNIN